MIDCTLVALWQLRKSCDSTLNSLAPWHRFLLKETQLSPLITSLLCNKKIDSTFSSEENTADQLLFFFFFLSEADQRAYLSVRQCINKTVWTTKICHLNSSISMQFDFLWGEKWHRTEMVVPRGFTSTLSQSNWFWTGSHSPRRAASRMRGVLIKGRIEIPLVYSHGNSYCTLMFACEFEWDGGSKENKIQRRK